MGICSSCESEEKRDERVRTEELARRRQVIEATKPIQLNETSTEEPLSTWEGEMVGELLERVFSARLGIPAHHCSLLDIEFADVVVSHDSTMNQLGIEDV